MERRDIGGGLVGGLHLVGLAHAEVAVPGMHLSIPPLAFVTFQMMFAILTAALLSGACADRMRFGAFVTFIAIWSVVVYAPLAHWAWSPGGWHQGLLLGGGLTQLGRQGLGVLAATVFAFTATYAIARALRATIGLRVEPDDEIEGLDSSQHAETAYEFTATSGLGRVS